MVRQITKQGKYLIVFLVLYICPIFFKNIFLEPTNVPRFAIISIFSLLAIIVIFYKNIPLVVPNTPLFISLILFYLINIISSSWALNIADALYASQRVFLAILLIIIGLSIINSEDQESLLVKSIIASASVYLFYAIVQIIGLSNWTNDSLYSVTSFSAHKNLLSSYLFLLLPFTLYGSILFINFWKFFSKLLFFLILFVLLFLQTRAVYLALVCSFIILGFLFIKKNRNNFKKLLIIFCACSITFIILSFVSDSFFNRINIFNYLGSESSQERLAIWRNTILLIKEYPFFGVGAGNWQYMFSKYSIGAIHNISNSEVSFQRPHNDFLWILSETGIVGFSLVAFVLLYLLSKGKAGLSNSTNREQIKIKILFSFLCGLLVISFFSFEMERITHITIASIIMALLIKKLGLSSTLKIINNKILISIISLCIILNLIISFYRLNGEYYTKSLFALMNEKQPQLIINYGEKALSPFYMTDPTSTPLFSYIGAAHNELNQLDKTLQASKKAYEIAPYDYKVLNNYGYILERLHRRKDAELILLEALRINHFYEPAIINMVVLKYNQGNYLSAIEWVNKLNKGNINKEFYEEKIKAKLLRYHK